MSCSVICVSFCLPPLPTFQLETLSLSHYFFALWSAVAFVATLVAPVQLVETENYVLSESGRGPAGLSTVFKSFCLFLCFRLLKRKFQTWRWTGGCLCSWRALASTRTGWHS